MHTIAEYKNTTILDVERSIVLSPSEMFPSILGREEISNTLSLEEALSSVLPPSVTGLLANDAMPSTPRMEMSTGLLPPIEESQVIHQRLQSTQAGSINKFRKILESSTVTLADTKGYRIRTAYRLIRQMSRVRGFLHGWERLQLVLDSLQDDNGLSAWYTPMRMRDNGQSVGYRGVRSLLYEIDRSKERYTFNTPNGYRSYKGVTTLPPPLPDQLLPVKAPDDIWELRIQGVVPEEYSPEMDKPLCLYCEAMTLLARQMGIEAGAPEEPWAGVYGLAGLLNPGAARLAWPTRDELIMYEEELLLHVFDILHQKSEIETQRYLTQFFGYTRFEAVDTVKMAFAAGGVLYSETAEEQKAVIMKRLDHIANKCSDACDPRAEFGVMKLKAQILGLTTQNEDESMSTLKDAAVRALKRPEDDVA